MSGGPGSRAGRLAAEFAVIVIGVLVALVLESWWSEREDRRFEAELREDMVAEFRENREILRADLAENDSVRTRWRGFLALDDADMLAMGDERFGGLLQFSSVGRAGFDPAMGSVQALVESGNVTAIRDRELRLRLARWAGLLSEGRRKNLYAGDDLRDNVLPTLMRARADRRWTPEERRMAREVLGNHLGVMQMVLDNQQQLLEAAGAILDYLDS